MISSIADERMAETIARNAVAAFERKRDGAGFHETGRETAVAVLIRELLSVMPTTSSDRLAAACNQGLDRQAEMGVQGPRVEAVDLADGSVTMQPGSWGV